MTSDAPVLDVLVLGGTSWVGGELAARARDRGHRVTCLARGEAGRPPEGTAWVRTDRSATGAYDEVAGHDWDAVLDVSWQPDLVRGALSALADRARHWVYVSSCSVYADDDLVDADEQAPLHPAHAGDGPVDWDVYGPAKVACEQACLTAVGRDRLLVARAGLIAGYGDRSDRLGYWPARIARAGDGDRVLIPPSSRPLQVIDVRDLVSWLVAGAEQGLAGTYNAVGDVTTVGAVLGAAADVSASSPRLVEATDDWLVARDVEPWAGPGSLPLWLPASEYAGFMTRRNDAATASGLTLRPLRETVAAALRWERERGLLRARRAGLTPDRESELLSALTASDIDLPT